MNGPDPSRSAMLTALMRAIHSRCDPSPLFTDLWGDRLVPEVFVDSFRDRVLARMDPEARQRAQAAPQAVLEQALRSNPAYADIVLRTRYAEDAATTAMINGIRQYVIVGAGFDSFALRTPRFSVAGDSTVFEIDHPITQEFKRRRLQECNIQLPDFLEFVPADLSTIGLRSALEESSFKFDEPAIFSWLGVTMYLTQEANLATLREISSLAVPGSELIFSYLDEKLFEEGPGHEAFRELGQRMAALGEPWLSGFNPTTLASQLTSLDHLLIEDLDGTQLVRRYDPTGANRLNLDEVAHIARTQIAS